MNFGLFPLLGIVSAIKGTCKPYLVDHKRLHSMYPCHCRLIQEEKQTTELRAEELESRVGSVEHMNLLMQGQAQQLPQSSSAAFNSHSSQSSIMQQSHLSNSLGRPNQQQHHLSVPPQPPPRSGRLSSNMMSYDQPQQLGGSLGLAGGGGISPPLSGRSTPKAVPNVIPPSRRPDPSSNLPFMHKYHTVSMIDMSSHVCSHRANYALLTVKYREIFLKKILVIFSSTSPRLVKKSTGKRPRVSAGSWMEARPPPDLSVYRGCHRSRPPRRNSEGMGPSEEE